MRVCGEIRVRIESVGIEVCLEWMVSAANFDTCTMNFGMKMTV